MGEWGGGGGIDSVEGGNHIPSILQLNYWQYVCVGGMQPPVTETLVLLPLLSVQIYDAYKRGTEALTSLRESLGVVVDDIDEVALNLQDALEANREISEALNQGLK